MNSTKILRQMSWIKRATIARSSCIYFLFHFAHSMLTEPSAVNLHILDNVYLKYSLYKFGIRLSLVTFAVAIAVVGRFSHEFHASVICT